MRILWLACCTLVLGICSDFPASASAQETKAPFHLGFQVMYTALDEHPEMLTVITNALRALPGVSIVDKDPDALLVINEARSKRQCACSLVVLVPEQPSVRARIDQAVRAYDLLQQSQTREDTDPGRLKSEDFVRQSLLNNLDFEPDGYSYGGGCVTIDPSPKTAMEHLIKNLDEGFVQRQRKKYASAPPAPSQPVSPAPEQTPSANQRPKIPGL